MEKRLKSTETGDAPVDFRTQTLLLICRHPFARVADVASWSYTNDQRVRRALRRLLKAGLVGRDWHSTQLLPRSYVYFPQPEGLEVAAGALNISVRELVRRYPVSVQRMRWIAHRLDSVAHLYALSATLASADRMQRPEERGRREKRSSNVSLKHVTVVNLYTSGSHDAIVRLRGGGTIGIIRQGPARSRSSLTDYRLRPFFGRYSIARGRRLPYIAGQLLVVVPTGWEARVIDSYLNERWDNWYGPPVTVVSEVAEVLSEPGDVASSLVLGLHGSSPSPPEGERLSETLNLPSRRHVGQMLRSHPLKMSRKGKEVLSVVSDMPWISRRDLATAVCKGSRAALSDSHMTELMTHLVDEHGVIRASGGRDSTTYAPDRRGIIYVAHQSRLTVPVALKKWGYDESSTDSVRASGGGGPEGRPEETEDVIQHHYPDHAQGVHWLISSLKSGIESLSPHYRFLWFLPTHRSKREWGGTAIEPDGIVEFLYTSPGEKPVRVPLMAEYERSAVHPGRSRRRLRRYTRYFGSGVAHSDHGAQPLILFVFDNERAESVFIQAASETGEALPILTSNREILSSVSADRFMLANTWWTLPLRSGRWPRHTLAGRIHDLRHRLLAWQ